MRTVQIPTVLIMSFLFAGCLAYTTYTGDLKPLSPEPHWARFFAPVSVDTLHPTFKWQAADSTRKVDLGIWQAVYNGTGLRNNTGSYEKGTLVYYVEGITGDEHEISTNLAPDTIYFWSIKPSGTMQWETANHTGAIGGTFQEANGLFFSLKTPSQ